MPTLPFDQDWRASQAITSSASCCSCAEYSRSGGVPSLLPKPRMSTRAPTNPRLAKYECVAEVAHRLIVILAIGQVLEQRRKALARLARPPACTK